MPKKAQPDKLPPIPAAHPIHNIKHKSPDGKYKSPPACDQPPDTPVNGRNPIPDTGDGRDL